MTAKILQHNGKVVYQSMYQTLIVEDRVDDTVQQDMVTFRETTEECLETKPTHAKLEQVGIPMTPEHLLYSNEDQNKMTFPDLDKEVMPEVSHEYVHALVMLLHGSQLMCSTVKAHKWDPDGNPIGRRLDNPILDT